MLTSQKTNKHKWKIVILGISGHLAQTKILPALGQFSYLTKDLLEIHLVGYSRSLVEPEQIEQILSKNTPNQKNYLASLQTLQGSYEDPDFYSRILSNWQVQDRLLIYLAVPPSQFLSFLQNSCPYNHYPINLILEKPFGQNLQEALKLLQIIENCSLQEKVYFFDHYLFKQATFISARQKKRIFELFKTDLQKIEIFLLEKETVGKRGGYYDSIGALKDMWIHVFSLLSLVQEVLTDSSTEVLLNNLNSEFFVNPQVYLAQYQKYKEEVQNFNSQTDTAFKILAQWKAKTGNIEVQAVSGKGLDRKETLICLKNSQLNLEWRIQPNPSLILKNSEKEILWQEDLQNLNNLDFTSLNLNNLQNSLILQDHTILFLELLSSFLGGSYLQMQRFISKQGVLDSWQIFENLKKNQDLKLKQYLIGSTYEQIFLD